ncbi:MAG: Ig-like domain-containing protein [Solirubrobacterales bacterium]
MNKFSLTLIALLAALATLGAASASAAPGAATVTVNGPAANGYFSTVPSLTFTTGGQPTERSCVLTGPGAFESEDGCTSPFKPLSSLPDGAYTYSVNVSNDNGGDTGTRNFNIDHTAPQLTMLSGVSDGTVGNSRTASYKLSYSDANLASVTCKSDSNTPNPCGSGGIIEITYDMINDGTHTYTFTAADKAGNVSTVVRTLTVDTIKPSAGIAVVGGGSESRDNTPAFQTSGSDASGAVTKQCSIEGQIDWTACNNDTWVVNDGVADGFITAWVAVSDKAGNTAFASYSFTLD